MLKNLKKPKTKTNNKQQKTPHFTLLIWHYCPFLRIVRRVFARWRAAHIANIFLQNLIIVNNCGCFLQQQLLSGKETSLTFLCPAESPTVLSSQPQFESSRRSKFCISMDSMCRSHGSPFLFLKQKTSQDLLSGYSSFADRAMGIFSSDPVTVGVCSLKKWTMYKEVVAIYGIIFTLIEKEDSWKNSLITWREWK